MKHPAGPRPIAIIGPGKIAQDAHVPAIAASDDFHLVATIGPDRGRQSVPHFASIAELQARGPAVEAVAICTPPQVRQDIARAAIAAGWHVLLEKPPAATVKACDELRRMATRGGVSLLAAWHSRFAGMVAPATAWLASRTIRQGSVIWREDVREFHPGQSWLWQTGGMGVFDTGINALSILTALRPERISVTRAFFDVPVNCQTPITAQLTVQMGAAPIDILFDFLYPGQPRWEITLETRQGETVTLSEGGERMAIDGVLQPAGDHHEYASLYAHFAALIRDGACDADAAPLGLVADAFRLAKQRPVAAHRPKDAKVFASFFKKKRFLPPVIFGDWGTTRLRLFLFEDGALKDRQTGAGIGAAGDSPWRALHETIAPWRTAGPLPPLVMCGMVGSRRGLVEVPYAPCPVDCAGWSALHGIARDADLTIHVAAGLSCDPDNGPPDVMRGEETQIFGALAESDAAFETCNIILPGTHSKWARVEEGRITRFRTFPTGEMFALLRDHSTLTRVDDDMQNQDAGFACGLDRAATAPGVMSGLFEARAAQLLRGETRGWAIGFLSGLLIGCEVAEALKLGQCAEKPILIGESALVALYAQALVRFGKEAIRLDGDACALAGLSVLQQSIFGGD